MALSRRVLLAAVAGSALAGCRPSARGGVGDPSPALSATATPAATAATVTPAATAAPAATATPAARREPTRAELVDRYGGTAPKEWGLEVAGVITALPDGERATALTFDACGGPGGNGYDADLIDFLRARSVPATLFLNARWIAANPDVFERLAADPLFEIGNHGTVHRPLSVSGRSAYGIAGTRDVGEVYDEVVGNAHQLAGLLGHPVRFFRSGTAHYDDVATRMVADLGERVAGFTVNGDGGATLSASEVRQEVAAAPPGSIVIGHMNHPGGGTAPGMAAAVPGLLAAGRRFVRLSDVLG
ncbi:peptidoglycan/xylan/chitin deacetylase (PgdA/CDA1 family) [Kitasatospora sp. MAA19]|uniref:polysaccharide deacetylase family protein n=1 Tax=Kitasatospora sp. MAA19 TaxID=3035090 RepID=UPI0024768159|nr:polysaccharide deacetylase family protein [Kitasatospora sp. MAA19]MDH6709278.1 peptidoglycan/xylan/chitin deacetylase (PgdA/CDA1 family) [Kitasatospora sp. MAA19]